MPPDPPSFRGFFFGQFPCLHFTVILYDLRGWLGVKNQSSEFTVEGVERVSGMCVGFWRTVRKSSRCQGVSNGLGLGGGRGFHTVSWLTDWLTGWSTRLASLVPVARGVWLGAGAPPCPRFNELVLVSPFYDGRASLATRFSLSLSTCIVVQSDFM